MSCAAESWSADFSGIPRRFTRERVYYSRTPLLRPPSKSDWSGRKTGVVVHEGLDYFITCGLRHTRIYILTVSSTPRTSFGVHCRTRENSANYPLHCYSVFRHRRPRPPCLTQNTAGLPLTAFSNNNAVFFLDQSIQHFDIGPYKTTFRKHRSNIGSHIYVACLTATFDLCPLYPSRPMESASCRPTS